MIDSTLRLHQAELLCQQKKARLTPLRKSVLQLLYEKIAPLTAYELLRLLREHYPKIEAMTVYRVLNFLEAHLLIHRITSCNAYAACNTPGKEHHAQLLLCEKCNRAEEIEAKHIEQTIHSVLKEYRFFASIKPIEIVGICRHCV